MDFSELTQLAVKAALKAGGVIRSYQDREVDVIHKEGGDTYASQVVTEVDRKAQDAILKLLEDSCHALGIAVLTEESEDNRARLAKEYFWCIDPMDGTLPFIRSEAGYSVSIALVARNGLPQIGVVYDPVHDVLWQATKGQGVQRNGEAWVLQSSGEVLTFTYDRSFIDRPECNKVLKELEAYANSLGLKGVFATQFGGAVINACHALQHARVVTSSFRSLGRVGSLWDYAATACLYEEAGAVASDVLGTRLTSAARLHIREPSRCSLCNK